MSYKNPTILLLPNPIGIDAVIQSMQLLLRDNLTWLEKSFGRAWEFKEIDPVTEKEIRVPKCYVGEGEYINVLPNDFLKAQSFFAVRGPESNPDYIAGYGPQQRERELSVIFWFNLKEVYPLDLTIYTEKVKAEVEEVLKQSPYLKSIDSYFDERVEDVFDGYESNAMSGRYSVNDAATQYLMHPYAGFRFNITVAYPYNVTCP